MSKMESTELLETLSQSNLYINRDLSFLAFNRRVLEMACDEQIPLLERLRFLCISSTNLDEFFEVRLAVQRQCAALGSMRTGADGLTAAEIMASARERIESLVRDQYQLFNDSLLPALQAEGVRFLRRDEWNSAQSGVDREIFQA